MEIFIANNKEALNAIRPHITVEAEFGDKIAEGSILTLGHHGPRRENPPPCLFSDKVDLPKNPIIGVSHIDLDALGGIMAVLGVRKDALFWRVAAEVDLRGPHKLQVIREEFLAEGEEEVDAQLEWRHVELELYAFWAYSEAHRVSVPREGHAARITDEVVEYIRVLDVILGLSCPEQKELLEAGVEWSLKKDRLDEASLVEESGGVVLRRTSGEFVNHLYTTQSECVVSFNKKWKSVTISLADPIPGLSCEEVVQTLWGPGAGGHAPIAGSPRDREMSMKDAEEAAAEMRLRLCVR